MGRMKRGFGRYVLGTRAMEENDGEREIGGAFGSTDDAGHSEGGICDGLITNSLMFLKRNGVLLGRFF
jgi:hypothetical protein